MPRRKRQLLEEDDSDSESSHSEDNVGFDAHNDPDEEDHFDPDYRRKRRKPATRSAMPTFVASSTTSAPSSSTPRVGQTTSSDTTPPTISPPKSPSPSSSTPTPTPEPPPTIPSTELPTRFGLGSTARAFMRSGVSSGSQPSTPPLAALPVHEQAHLRKIGGSLGAQMLAKMGWTAGTGLGTTGEGIVVPIETKLRPKNIGIAFRGFREKTDQSRLEARRRGEVVSDDEKELTPEQRKKAREAREVKERRAEAWKRPRKVRTKVEHKTFEEIIAEAGQEPAAIGLGQIIDATGPTLREVASIAEVSLASWTPSTDSMRIPEVRHNLRLITEACKTDLDGLAREAKTLQDRKRFIMQEDARLQIQVTQEAELISRLQKVTLVVDDVVAKSKELASSYDANLDDFSPLFSRLLIEFSTEFERYRLDVIVVAAVLPLVRRTLAQWDPLQEPAVLLSTFRTWKQALVFNQVDLTGDQQPATKPMTPFESLLWHVWLPRVRTCINNDWSPEDPVPVVKLYEMWSPLLPPFVRDNILDQLILPKLTNTVADWRPKRTVSLHTFVFPWLPHLGLRSDTLLDDARRKVKSLLRAWNPPDGVPRELTPWQAVFTPRDWDTLLLTYVVPKLAASLRADFRVNPRAQDMAPLTHVLAWSALLRSKVIGTLLEAEFFPKWLDALHLWLTQPRASFQEVADWYEFWRSVFKGDVAAAEGLEHGFRQGLEMMHAALALSPDERSSLPRPKHRAVLAASEQLGTAQQKVRDKDKDKVGKVVHAQEITFRAIVEEVAAKHDLLFVPAGRVHEGSRMPLFRVSRVAGRGGVLVYVLDDAVWAPDASGEGDGYRAITLEEMVLRASA